MCQIDVKIYSIHEWLALVEKDELKSTIYKEEIIEIKNLLAEIKHQQDQIINQYTILSGVTKIKIY
jgi:hypothetical protein